MEKDQIKIKNLPLSSRSLTEDEIAKVADYETKDYLQITEEDSYEAVFKEIVEEIKTGVSNAIDLPIGVYITIVRIYTTEEDDELVYDKVISEYYINKEGDFENVNDWDFLT